MDDDGDAGDVACGELDGYGVDGVADPGADFGVAVLVHGEVVGFGGEEGLRGVDVAVVEDVVDGDGQEGVEGGEEDVGVVQGERRGGVGVGVGVGLVWWRRHCLFLFSFFLLFFALF